MSKIAHNVKELARLAVWLVMFVFGLFVGAFVIVAILAVVGILIVLAI